MITGPEPILQPPSTDQETTRVELMGKPFWLDRNKPTQRYLYECVIGGWSYEGHSAKLIHDSLNTGDYFFDIGANCGWFSAIAASKGACIVAFEPDADNCRAIARNVPGAMVVRAPVSDKAGNTPFFENLDNDGGHSLWPCGSHPFNERTRNEARAPKMMFAVTLDSYADYKPTVIKCDTEGAEMNVLLGATKLLIQPTLRVVILEKNEYGLQQMGHTPEEVETIMLAAGFENVTDNRINWHFTR